jgi:DNA repair photolyase
LEAVARLAEAGIPVAVNVAPVIPGLTDSEIPALVAAAKEAGATTVRYLLLRLPGAVAGLFEAWLEEHFPERKKKVLARVREVRGGRLNDPRFGHRFRGQGVYAEQIHGLFMTACRRVGISTEGPELSTAAFRRPDRQRALF